MFYLRFLIDPFSVPTRFFWSILSKSGDFTGISLKITRKRILLENETTKKTAAKEKLVLFKQQITESSGIFVDRKAPSFDSFERNNTAYVFYVLQGDKVLYFEEKRPFINYKMAEKAIIKHRRRYFNLIGREVFLLTKVRDGLKCSCWNDILKKVEDPNCPSCGGTGYFDGYFDPVMTKVVFNGKPVPLEAMIDGASEERLQQTFSFPDFPIVCPGDIVVDEFGYRYVVNTVNSLGPRACTLEQQVAATLISRSDRIYKIPVVDCKSLVFSDFG